MINKQKGTYDLYGKKAEELKELESVFENFMMRYNYKYIRTPLIEATELFHRSSGETSDIVSKETYDFVDRGGRNITLRPEGTAGAVRAYIEDKMYVNGLTKLWYFGPMYRYERPQKGRYREHFQFGCEAFGSDDPALDAEMISILVNFLNFIGLEDIKVNINTLGDKTSRDNYRNALIDYLTPHIDNLCDDCKTRFTKNPLRILDCKVDSDTDILKNAPKITDYLTEDAKDRFDKVLSYLSELGIPYEVDTNIVRGLDYYTHTVFEIELISDDKSSKIALSAGGRYNNLVKDLGGPDTPAIGFGIGSERVLEVLESLGIELCDEEGLDCYVIPLSDNEKKYALSLAETLRYLDLKVEFNYNKSVKNALKEADKLGVTLAILIGEDEIKNNYITVKNMKLKEEEKVPSNVFISYLMEQIRLFGEDFICDPLCEDCDCGCDCGCDCDTDCTCGCKDGKECTCHDEGCICKEK